MMKFNRLIANTLLTVSLFGAAQASAANLCNQVWNGTVERLRVQEQASGETVVRLYLHPGNNADYAGYTTSEFMVDALHKAKDGQIEVTGYTDDKCKIKWMDVR